MVHPQLQANQREIIQGGNPAILNINTASDINIYNNSFIVNTGGAGIGMTKKP